MPVVTVTFGPSRSKRYACATDMVSVDFASIGDLVGTKCIRVEIVYGKNLGRLFQVTPKNTVPYCSNTTD